MRCRVRGSSRACRDAFVKLYTCRCAAARLKDLQSQSGKIAVVCIFPFVPDVFKLNHGQWRSADLPAVLNGLGRQGRQAGSLLCLR